MCFSHFLLGGAAVIYEEIFGKKYAKRHFLNRSSWMLVFVFGFLLMALVMLILRHDLILDALFSGLLLSLVAFIFYSVFFTLIFPGIIERWWMLSNISGIQISHTPLEELMCFFGWGMVAGPAYEFVRGLGLKKTA